MLYKTLSTLLLVLGLSSSSFALVENNYADQYNRSVVPLIHSMGEGFFTGEKNIHIHYRTYLQDGAKNCLVILPGRTEPVEKYGEVVFDLLQTDTGKNLNFYLMDHRGQGSSGKMKSPSDMGYVDQFKNYVLDLASFLKDMKLDSKCEKKFLLAHSMGAGIATAFILDHPNYFDKIVYSSPMFKILTAPYPYSIAKAIVLASTIAGRGAKFALGQKGFDSNAKFENNHFTTSPARFDMTMSVFKSLPVTQLGDVSNNWILETMRGTKPLRSRYHEIATPLKVFHGAIETYVDIKEIVKFCDQAINCERKIFPTSKHEVLMGKDETRSVVMNSLVEFFN